MPLRSTPVLLATLPQLLLTGCSRAPSHALFGAYFPSWLLFALLWLALAIAVRVVQVLTGAAADWPWPLALCTAAGFLLALGGWWLGTGALP